MIKKIKEKLAEKKREKHILRNAPSAYDEAVLSWIAPETIKHERGTVWKVIIGLLIIGTAIWGILNNAWTFSLVIVVFSVTYYLAHLEHPKHVEIKISNIGIKVGGRKYPYNRVRAFWLIYDPPYVRTLNIRVSGDIATDITIQLDRQNPSELREFLMDKIPEMEGQSEKLSDILLRLLKI
ncbi:MAG: hypothetical protein O3B47_05045 [bacterium]|nr:hypothetical protein [bacterium]